MDELQFKACLSYLHEISAIGFIDIYDECNSYIIQDFEAIWKEDTINELIEYSRKFTYAIHSDQYQNQYQYQYPLFSPRSSDCKDSFKESQPVSISDIQSLFSLFHANFTIYQICQSSIFHKISSSIDLHRFVVFSCIHGILRRIYIYPTLQENPSSFYYYFRKSIKKDDDLRNQDFIGLSVDDYSNGEGDMETILPLNHAQSSCSYEELNKTHQLVAAEYYRELFAIYKHSNFHLVYAGPNGMSRHSSLVSMNQEHVMTKECECKPDKEVIVQMMKNNQCLEAMSVKLECCIPSIMEVLQEMDNVLFLKR